jgi:hypothetical protein
MARHAIGFILMGLTFGPMERSRPRSFAPTSATRRAGVAYNTASMLGASLAPFITIALWQYGAGSPVWVGVDLSAMDCLSLVALLLAPETRDADILR